MNTLRTAGPGDEITVAGHDGHITAVERYRSPALSFDIWYTRYAAAPGPALVVLVEGQAYAADVVEGAPSTEPSGPEHAVRGSAQFERFDGRRRRFGRSRFTYLTDGSAIEMVLEQAGKQTRLQGQRLPEGSLEHYPA